MDGRTRIQLQRVQKALADEFVETLCVLVLVQGVLENGKSHYAYARIPKDQYLAFKYAEATGSYDIRVYGEVLAHGEGLEPPESVRTDMRLQYGVSHMFEEDLVAAMTALEPELFHSETNEKMF